MSNSNNPSTPFVISALAGSVIGAIAMYMYKTVAKEGEQKTTDTIPNAQNNVGYFAGKIVVNDYLKIAKNDEPESYKGRILTGQFFKKLMAKTRFVKFTNSEEIHDGVFYGAGINKDVKPFNPTGSCKSGGLYFCDWKYANNWIDSREMHKWCRFVIIPDNALVYMEDPASGKYKADMIDLSGRISLDDRDSLSYFVGEEIPGSFFNVLTRRIMLIKYTHYDENHNGYVFNTGLNIDPIRFDPTGTCKAGGLYFTSDHSGSYWAEGHTFCRNVRIPDRARVYIETTGSAAKYKADMFVLGPKSYIQGGYIQRDYDDLTDD